MKPRAWFRFSNQASDPTVAEIFVIDIIGDWIDELINDYYGVKATLTAKAFLEQLSKLDASVKTIRVRINSPGGDVFAALTIANALRDQQTSKGRTVETIVDGLAASAASVIAMAGKTVCMADNALMMIHNPWSFAIGEAKEMRKAADTLDTIRLTLVKTYQWHTELSDDEVIALLDAETWMDATEAVAKGFATETVEGLQAAASIDPRVAASMKVPEQFKDRIAAFLRQPEPAPVAATALEVLTECETGGCNDLAKALIAAGATLDQVKAKVTETKATRDAETARVRDIRAVCAAAKQPDLANDFIRGGISVDGAKAALTRITAAIDATTTIDGTLPIDANGAAKALPTTAQIYAARNASR